MDAGVLVQAVVTFILGAGGIKGVDMFRDWRRGRLEKERECWRRRDEAINAQRELERKVRMLTESLHGTRVIALKHGISQEELGEWPEF